MWTPLLPEQVILKPLRMHNECNEDKYVNLITKEVKIIKLAVFYIKTALIFKERKNY